MLAEFTPVDRWLRPDIWLPMMTKNKSKKAKRLSEEALQIAEERSEKQGRKGNVHPIKHRVPKNNKERQEGLLQ